MVDWPEELDSAELRQQICRLGSGGGGGGARTAEDVALKCLERDPAAETEAIIIFRRKFLVPQVENKILQMVI